MVEGRGGVRRGPYRGPMNTRQIFRQGKRREFLGAFSSVVDCVLYVMFFFFKLS